MILILLSTLIAYEHSTDIKHIDFNKQDVLFLPADGYTKMRMIGCEITDEIGAPEVPVKAVKVALPNGARNVALEIIAVETEILDGDYLISCAQPPVILSQMEVTKFTAPNAAIYESDELYPESPVRLSGVGTYDNHQLCELLIHPLQYEPRSRKIKFHRSIQFRITYEDGIKSEATSNNLSKMVINPEELSRVEKKPTRSDVTYMIISNPPLDTVFERLSHWKTKKGIPSQVRTVDWIVANYTGEDNAARIRNYIQTLPDSNIQYVLLGGDTYMIPCRFAYAMTCSAYIWNREDSLPCDLYYADLQGDWNFDGDGLYGEVEDSIDLYPDVLVGRAPVSSVAQAQSFVNKILTYEKNPPQDYLDNVLLLAEILWTNPYTDQAVHKNRIDAEILPANLSVTKLYETLGNENRVAVMSAIRDGQSLINHDGHGSSTLMGVGNGYLNYSDLDTITNAPQYGIIITIGCWTGAFDFACIGEAFVKNANGGGVAFIGNSSYGWGSPGNPGYGYSDIFDSRFFYSLLLEDNYHIGEALAMCKTHFIPYSREKNVYRWHQYQLNLLGDPEMMVWTALPDSIVVAAPQSIPLGNSTILFTIKNNSGVPVSNALVCLMKGTESYAAGYTDETGQVFLEANAGTMGDFELTVTAHNHIPSETVIPVVNGSYVNYRGWILNDTAGNADGIGNPNESILLSLALKNDGNAAATNINMRLRSDDPYVTVTDSIEYLSTLNAGDSTLIDNAFNIAIGAAADGHVICFQLEITETSRVLSYYPSMMVGTPILNIDEFYDAQRPTMPGDTASIYLEIANRGHGIAHAPSITLYSNDPYASIITDSITAPDIPPETTHTVGPFEVAISSGCPLGHHPQLSFAMSTESYVFGQDVILVIGETGFADDMESGSGLWTTGGTNNQWHISERHAFSPTHAWYCGQEGNGLYVNNMNCYIQTIPFMVDHSAILRFKRWFQVPIYGSDGIYVIIAHGTGSDTLDFIGTGGALGGGRDIQGDWFEQEYPLSEYAGGDTIQIRIAFISDADGAVAEGFYIDDLNITTTTFIEDYANEGIYSLTLEVNPNPSRHTVNIRYMIHDSGYMEDENRNSNFEMRKQTLKIYDAAGRMVRDFRITLDALRSTLVWDGCDDLGRSVAPGVYFAILATEDNTLSTKIVRVR